MHLPDNDNFHFFFSTKQMLFGLSAIFARHSALQNAGSVYFCTKGSNLVFYIFIQIVTSMKLCWVQRQ